MAVNFRVGPDPGIIAHGITGQAKGELLAFFSTLRDKVKTVEW
jgi:hypothetical protein